MDSAELMARAREKARKQRLEKEEQQEDPLKAIRDRFMARGPAQYRVMDDEWWNR